MFKDRSFIIVIIVVLLLVAAFLIWRRNTGGLFGQQPEQVPLALASVIPADWNTLPDQQYQCDFDSDGKPEWLIAYHYDQTQIQQPYQKEGVLATRSPIGAAIFDTQNNPMPSNSGNPSPYQPTLVIPYRLLPDLYEGKGQGYLGESSVIFTFYPAFTQEVDCKVEEITVLGYSDFNSDLPTRLSIFRWKDEKTGYLGAHFIGDARIAVNVPLKGENTVTDATTYNRLHNHRSLLCEVSAYYRDTTQPLVFNNNFGAYTIDFCFGSPPDPTYPEGVVISYLRGNTPQLRSADAPAVPTDSYLLKGVIVPAGVVPGPSTRIFSVTNQSSVGSTTTGGEICTDQQINAPSTAGTPIPGQGWICGRASATVETEVVFPDMVRRVTWELISLNPEQVNGDVHWRIKDIQVMDSP